PEPTHPFVAVEGGAKRPFAVETGKTRGIDQEQIEATIAVIVEERTAAAQGFRGERAAALTICMAEMDTGFGGHVDEPDGAGGGGHGAVAGVPAAGRRSDE